jgi:hypothetical protein
MIHRNPASIPPVGLGLISLVLGTIGLLLFFLPILGVPIGGAGLIVGLVGLLGTVFGLGRGSLRWAVAGVAVCMLAVVTNLAIAFAPAGYSGRRTPPELWRPISDVPYVPPPAPPGQPR